MHNADSIVLLSQSTQFLGNNSVTVSNLPSINSSVGFTLSTCMRQKTGVNGYILANSLSASSDQRCLSLYADASATYAITLFFGRNVGPTLVSVSSDSLVRLDDAQPHQVIVTVTSTTVTFYVDGQQFGNPKQLTGTQASSCPEGVTFIGKRAPSNVFFQGALGPVRAYSRALQPSDFPSSDC
jgi:hypothetical protein